MDAVFLWGLGLWACGSKDELRRSITDANPLQIWQLIALLSLGIKIKLTCQR